jgi:hypothetical protein
MPNYINIGGKLCVNTKEFGYVSVQDYLATQILNRMEEEPDEIPQTINANTMLISNQHPRHLSKEEVLDVFVQYIHKYRDSHRNFDIPVGTKYMEYSDYIQSELRRVFPEIRWRVIHKTEKAFIVRGETL